jgi:hypothetical protein
VSLVIGGRAVVRDLAAPGEAVSLPLAGLPPGWHSAQVTLAPDELRLDDTARLALRSAEPAAVTVGPGAGRFVESAILVLEAGGRVRRGGAVTIADRPGPGRTVILPPADPAQVGAVNRALSARGAGLRFEEPVTGEWAVESALPEVAGTRLIRRHRLSGNGTVLATAGGEPWLVKSGDHLVVGSRFEPEWTSVPLSAGFVPLLDALLNRLAAAEVWRVAARPGDVAILPPAVAAALFPQGRVAVSGDRRVTAPAFPGVFFLAGSAGDTVGALEVNPDPRESRLAPAAPAAVRAALGPRAEVHDALEARVFTAGRRAEITTALLVLALLLAAGEFALASAGGLRRAEPS